MSEEEDYKETWFIVPAHIVDLEGMTIGRLRVFQTIFQFWNKSRKCFLSNPEISKRTGLKITQVKEAIAYFEKNRELERVQIGLKRYLIQPLKVVEIPGLELVPKEVAGKPATCTNVTQVAGEPAEGGRQTGLQVAGKPATEIKNLNKEIKKPINKGISFSLEEALADNPHNLSIEILEEWNTIRIKKHKSPLTARAWKRTNNVLSELISKGLKLSELIDRMLAAEWRGIEVSYFEKEIKALNPTPKKFPTADEREANEQKIRQREKEAEERKKAELEAAKNSNGLFEEIKKRSRAELNLEYEAKRAALGMTRMEYHEYLIKNANNG